MRARVHMVRPTSGLIRGVAPLIFLLCMAASGVQQDALDPYERGDMLSQRLMEGDVAALEQAMTPRFLASLGGRDGLARLVAQSRSQVGREVEVVRQAAYAEAGHVTYYRVSRFERMPSVTTRWVFDGERRVAALSVRPTQAPSATRHEAYRTRGFQLPFAAPVGGYWYVAWGGNDHISNKHVVARDQRFAYDFVLARGGAVFRGDGTRNEDHYCWDEPLFAPAAGRVVSAVGGVADNPPGTSPPTAPPPGNHVVIDHGNGAFSIVAHLRLGSLAVRQGQHVTQATLLGRCGNSGRSDLPHVHYHLQNAAAYGEGEGLPITFGGYFTGAIYVPEGRPVRGEYLTPTRKLDPSDPHDPPPQPPGVQDTPRVERD